MTIGGCEKRDCPAFDKCTAQYRGSRCAALRYSYGLDDPKTNYDRIISKSPEELAEIMVSDCPPNYPKGERCEYEKNDGNLDCAACWLDWLKEEETE